MLCISIGVKMSEDFEQAWQRKFKHAIGRSAIGEAMDHTLADGTALSDRSPRSEVIAWTRSAIEELAQLVPRQMAEQVLSDCACHYAREALEPLREIYALHGDIAEIHTILDTMAHDFLRDSLALEEAEIEEVVANGWGLAGNLDGHIIVVTKIPKSGNLKRYLQEEDPLRRRELYCHCPRVREAIRLGVALPKTYCQCGAGFYKNIWETILAQPVEVEVLSSVLAGDEVCRFGIVLPGKVPA